MKTTTKGKTAHYSELPAVSTLGGWDRGWSYEATQAYQWLRVRLSDDDYLESIVRVGERMGKDVGASLCAIAERMWEKQERAS